VAPFDDQMSKSLALNADGETKAVAKDEQNRTAEQNCGRQNVHLELSCYAPDDSNQQEESMLDPMNYLFTHRPFETQSCVSQNPSPFAERPAFKHSLSRLALLSNGLQSRT
jgi:hypothetical protein